MSEYKFTILISWEKHDYSPHILAIYIFFSFVALKIAYFVDLFAIFIHSVIFFLFRYSSATWGKKT